MHFINEYGLFLAKILTVVLSILVLAGIIPVIAAKNKNKEKPGKLTLHKINDKYKKYQETINNAAQTKAERKLAKKNQKNQVKATRSKKRLFWINFQGDVQASAVNSLREEITAILLAKKAGDEVLLSIESGGGLIHTYGLAAAQIQRLKDEDIKVTVAVDKIAASGGYLLACLADQLIAAPFAIIGSIGVIAQLPNFHRWLEKKDIDFEQIFAGQYKRTLSLFGKNTPEGRKKLQGEINEAHHLFKSFIERYRPQINIEQVATGEHWFAARALELNLLDEIKTSDDFLLAAREQYDIYQIKYEYKRSLIQRLGSSASMLIHRLS